MSTIQEIERAVERLAPDEQNAFRAWFTSFDSDAWDRQLEADVEAGKLDELATEALADLRARRCSELCITGLRPNFGPATDCYPALSSAWRTGVSRCSGPTRNILRCNSNRLAICGPRESACIIEPWPFGTEILWVGFGSEHTPSTTR